MNKHWLRKTTVISACCLTAYCLLGSPTAFSLPLNHSFPATSSPVSNYALSKIIGRGVIGGTIVYFGVEMQTNWTSSLNQAKMQSSMNVALNSQGNIFTPTITFSTQGGIPNAESTHNNTVNGEGLKNIQGVTQAIQIGGNDNSVQNGMSLNVIKGKPTLNNSGINIPLGTQTKNGVTTTIQPGQLSVELSNGITTIRQGIGSNGVFQISQVGNNMNQIQNHITLTLGVNPLTTNALNQAQMESIMRNLPNLQGMK